MNLKKYIPFVLTAFVFASCQKDVDVFIPDPGQPTGPDTTWVGAVTEIQPVSLLKKDIQLNAVTDSFESGISANTVLWPSGLQCDFFLNSVVDASSNPVAGKVFVEAMFLKTRGEMIKMNRLTVSDEGKLLVSGGALNVKIINGDTLVDISKGEGIEITSPAQGDVMANKLFFGEETTPGVFKWVKYNNDFQGYLVSSSNSEYKMKCRRTGWISPAKIFESPAATTTVSAKLPSHFTNANTSVYLVFRNMLSVIELVPDVAKRKFITNVPVPVGLPITMVVISRQGNDYYLGHADATSAAPSTSSEFQQMASNPKKVSFEQLDEYISGL